MRTVDAADPETGDDAPPRVAGVSTRGRKSACHPSGPADTGEAVV